MHPQDPIAPDQQQTTPPPSVPATPASQPQAYQPASSDTGHESPYNPAYFVPSEVQDYSTVPVFRRRWLVILITLAFIPLGALIIWTGDVYLQNQKTKQVYKFTNRQKILFTIVGAIIIVNNINLLSHH